MGRQHLSHKDKAQQVKEDRDTRDLITNNYGPWDSGKEQMGDLADSAVQP